MRKCRYIPQSELPKIATDEEINAILAALAQRRYILLHTALRYVVGPWRMTSDSFITTIRFHLESGYRIFQKTVPNPPQNTVLFSANIGLDPDSDEEDEDVYVEIRLKNHAVVIICDAHNHDSWKPRLPK